MRLFYFCNGAAVASQTNNKSSIPADTSADNGRQKSPLKTVRDKKHVKRQLSPPPLQKLPPINRVLA